MRSWVRNKFRGDVQAVGSFDVVTGEYNLTFENWTNPYTGITLSFNEVTKGWVSFKSFIQANGISVSGKYITTYKQSIWLHNDETVDRNTFYDNPHVNSKLTMIFNSSPGNVKSFKSIDYEGSQARVVPFLGTTRVAYTGNTTTNSDGEIIGSETALTTLTDNEIYNLSSSDGWFAPRFKTDLAAGSVLDFKEKEGKWFNYIVGDNRPTFETAGSIDTSEFTTQGIGQVGSVVHIDDYCEDCAEDCIPPCPSDMECVPCQENPAGCCEPIGQVVLGCMDSTASNYAGPGNTLGPGGTEQTPVATLDDGSCTYNVTGCMDPMNPYYDQWATQTFDTSDGTLGDTFDYGCYPFCTDCPAYSYGCQDENAENYNPLANIDGYCSYQGVVVPCWQVVISDPSDPNYNGNVWTDAGFSEDEIGYFDTFTVEAFYSCSYCADCCPEGQSLNNLGECVDDVLGCTNPEAPNYNAAATVDDGSCEDPVPNTPGCTDQTACNYNPLADYDNGTCEWSSCLGCTDPTACNYNPDATIDDGTCCEVCEQDECIDVVPGCLEEGYQEYCGPGNTYGIDPPCNTSCGGYPEEMCGMLPGGGFLGPCNTWTMSVLGCMDDSANNYNMNATVDDGSCTYTFYGCTDPSAANYYLNYYQENDVQFPPYYTVFEDDGSCEYTGGCMDPEAFNYNPDPPCYNDYSTYAGNNWPSGAGWANSASNTFWGCEPWIYGCLDPAATNYAGPGNPNFVDPPANTQVGMVGYAVNSGWTVPGQWGQYSQGGGWAWTPGEAQGSTNPEGVGQAFDNGPLVAVGGNGGNTFWTDCYVCECEYPSLNNMQLDVENYQDDTNEPDMLYDEYPGED